MLKIIAALLMLIDHIGMVFFEEQLILRIIGRLSMPLFAYCIANGFYKTRSIKRYLMRMSAFAVISQVPFWIMMYVTDQNNFNFIHFNIGFTFLGALLTLYLYKQIKENTCFSKVLNGLLMIGILVGSTLMRFDYGAYAILIVIVFYEFYILQKNVSLTLMMFVLVTGILFVMGRSSQFVIQLFAIPALYIIVSVQDKPIKQFKYFFYIFYPAHMLVLSIIKWLQ
ncbi:MAG: conjugal transfer protein TraX [Clostridia bacterium]|jgi:hypothetical protein|nr:conjugal transfer protein TraX [Clostridia bacterium]